jgi:hypothetical protein
VVSRRHAEIRLEGRDWILVDLGSSNGTRLNGRNVGRCSLRPLDTLTFGEGPGAEIRVLALDPTPSMGEEHGEDRTRQFSMRRARPTPPPVPVVEPLSTPPRSTGPLDVLRIFHPIVVLGMAFGLLTAWEFWGPSFPYVATAAPALWGIRLVNAVVPEFVAEQGDWLLRFLLALWFGLAGLGLERPLRARVLLLILLGAGHAFAALSITGAI